MISRKLAILGCLAFLASAFLARPGLAVPVDLELVLAVDVSASVDEYEAAQQRNGYLGALARPEILEAIQSGPLGQIALTYVEWAGESFQRTVVDWTLVRDAQSLSGFVEALRNSSISSAPYTSISALIDFARERFRTNAFEGSRRVIDISGDGPNSAGRQVKAARDDAVTEGIVINGLPVFNARPNPKGGGPAILIDWYYARNVIGGPGAFMMRAETENFTPTVLRKLFREISGDTEVSNAQPRAEPRR